MNEGLLGQCPVEPRGTCTNSEKCYKDALKLVSRATVQIDECAHNSTRLDDAAESILSGLSGRT